MLWINSYDTSNIYTWQKGLRDISQYIILTLDTTEPNISIYAPSYTTQHTRTEIEIESNEHLAEWQEIYIIDSLGVRHDLTFSYEETRYVGVIYFEGYPLGVATIHARLMDDVGNKSAIVSKAFNIVSSETLNISISESLRKVNISESIKSQISVSKSTKNTTMVKESIQYVKTTESVRYVSASDEKYMEVIIKDELLTER